jgi:tetratricopeptide (TPR) repeat protein
VKAVDITFGILGRTAVRIGDTFQEDWSAPKVQALLATLLAHAGRSVPLDTLIDWAWPEEQPLPQNRAATFHTYATRIRRVLQRLPSTSTLHTGNGAFRLDVDKSLIDYHRFRSLVTQARVQTREQRPQQAVDYLEKALELWRGRPLDDLNSEPAHAWRRRVLRDEWLPANIVLLEALLKLGNADQVLARLNTLPVDYAVDVTLARLRLSALHRMARMSEVTAYYFDVRRQLLDVGDEQAADHLRQHHEYLRTQRLEPLTDTPGPGIEVPRELPRDILEFVGRDDQLRALDTATTSAAGEMGRGVVILDGMPGVGKSVLAVHWAHTVRHRFNDGDFFVNLNGFSDTGMVDHLAVVDDLLIAMGHHPDDMRSPRSRELLLSRLMANRRTLVILDNARSTDHIGRLVSLLADSLILVTSRQRLTSLSATTGARRIQVPPLSARESAELLTLRLGAEKIEDQNRADLARLCGGLPLVISIVAEHVATSGTSQLSTFVRQLGHRQIIAEFGEDGDSSTMARTFFSWSYDALPPSERRLFRLLGLHSGSDISIEVAAACGGLTSTEIKKSFGILVGAHLLERPDVVDRYRFHDLLREFATYCAERYEPPDQQQDAERRMICHYLAAATEAHQLLYPGHLTPPQLPLENGVASVQFADASHAQRWYKQERTNLNAAIGLASSHEHHDYAWRLADTVATFLDRYGEFDDSQRVRETAVAAAKAAGDREAEASGQAGLGMVLATLGKHEEARRCLDASLRYAEDTDNRRGQAATLHQLGKLEMSRGAVGAAAELFQRCLDIAQRSDDSEVLCWSHASLGEALRSLNDYNGALFHLRQSEFLAQRISDKSAHASSLASIGAIYRDRGDPEAAMTYCKQALTVTEALPDMAIAAEVCITLGEVSHERGDTTAARTYCQRALDLCSRMHTTVNQARAYDALGNMKSADGDAIGAVDAWQHALTLYQRFGNAAQASAVQAKIDEATTSPRRNSAGEGA